VCPTEITAFSDRHGEFKAVNTEVLGVSVDSQFAHLAWIQTDRKEGEQHCCPALMWAGQGPSLQSVLCWLGAAVACGFLILALGGCGL
jgi:hypothetical protein